MPNDTPGVEHFDESERALQQEPIIKEIETRAKAAVSKVKEWNDEAKEDFRFTLGQQWTEEEKTKLNNEKRPALTFNKIEPLIDFVSGFQSENTARIKANPEGGEDKVFSEIADRCVKAIDKWGKLDYKMGIQFEEGSITGKAWLEAAVNYDKDPFNGDLKFSVPSASMILKDPDSVEYDLSDCGYIIKLTPLTKEKLKTMYPAKKATIDGFRHDTSDILQNTETFHEGDADNYHLGKEDVDSDTVEPGDNLGPSQQKYTLAEYWHKKPQEKYFVYNTLEDMVETFDSNDEAEKKKEEILSIYKKQYEDAKLVYQNTINVDPEMAQKMGEPVDNTPEINVVKRSVDKMYYAAVCCGHIMEEDQSSPLSPSYEGYPFFQFLAKYRPNAPDEKLKIKGLARNLKDPQREINKSKSQFLHIVSTAANSGWVGDRDALSDPKKKDLEQMGSKPGVCVWKKPGSELTQISPPGLPLAQKMRGEDATQDIKEIAGINTDALAIQDKTTSGKAIALRIKQAITILAKMFKNFRLTRELVGGALFNMIPNIFDVRKLEKTLGQQFLEENQIGRGYLKAFLTQIEDGRFDLVITEADSSATVRLETFDQLMEMQKAGVPIPPDLAIEFSSIPNSKEILERIKAYATEQANAEGEGNRRP